MGRLSRLRRPSLQVRDFTLTLTLRKVEKAERRAVPS